jgi:DNA-binding transcriptional LysR family regulator
MSSHPSAEDLRTFLTVAKLGRLTKAADALGLDHSTVSRRITKFEAQIGQPLFDRSSHSWILTTAGRLLLGPAEAIDEAMKDFDDIFNAREKGIFGTVRVCCPDALGTYLIAPRLAEVVSVDTGPLIELTTSTRNLEDQLRDFDIVVTMERPTGGGVKSWHLSRYDVGFYSTEKYLSTMPPLRVVDDIQQHLQVGFIGRTIDVDPLETLQRSLMKSPDLQLMYSALQVQAVLGGAGIAAFPVFVQHMEPKLVRVLPDYTMSRNYWLTVASSTRQLGAVGKVVEFITKLVEENRELLIDRS